MILELPYPPSNNRYYRHARGRTYLSPEGISYRLQVLEKRPRFGWPLMGRIRALIEVHPNRSVSQDLDNCCKAILDSLQHASIYYNDSQIDDLRVVRMPKNRIAHVVVTLETMGDAA